MFEVTTNEDVIQFYRPETRWLSTGWDGGYSDGPAAYNVSVPEGWGEVDLDAYAVARRERAGFDALGPSLFTGVDLQHARGTRCGPVEAVVTAGVSNPAALPMEPKSDQADITEDSPDHGPGTVNIIVGTTEALSDGALATLLACVVEAKTATLRHETGFSGTTTDAVVVGCDTNGTTDTKQPFAGSATSVGAATRACVREGVRASLTSRYAETPLPESVADAPYGVMTTRQAEVFEVVPR
jgi:adenosylcobinamide hydrolase